MFAIYFDNFTPVLCKIITFSGLPMVAAALFVFGGLHFDLVLGLTRAFSAFLYFL